MLSITFLARRPDDLSLFSNIALGVFDHETWAKNLEDFLDRGSVDAISRVRGTKLFKAEAGEVFSICGGEKVDRLLLTGLGKEALTEASALKVGGKLAAALETQKVDKILLALPDKLSPDMCALLLQGVMLRSWRYSAYKKKNAIPLKEIVVWCDDVEATEKAFLPLKQIAESVLWARELVNAPANALDSDAVLREMKALEPLGLTFEALDKEKMASLGMEALLGVAQGSEKPPYLGIVRWKGNTTEDAPIAFVGKGVTFDSGGLSLKPSAGMQDMKGDMGGAAVVLGLMRSLALTKAPVNAVGVVALVENMPSGTAQRPGDIVTAMNGKTIEVLNTDAEGRLILADALVYTERTFKPRMILDVATLTGAMRFALGPEYAGLFTPELAEAKKIMKLGNELEEKVWHLPLCEAFTKAMEGTVSDLQNISPPGFGAGSSTAAAFLQCFVEKTPWVHLDIANVDMNTKDTPLATKGGCAFGIRLLYRWVTTL